MMARYGMWRGTHTWQEHPKRDEYRRMNWGFGACNLSQVRRRHCVLHGIGCDVDHVAIRLENDKGAA